MTAKRAGDDELSVEEARWISAWTARLPPRVKEEFAADQTVRLVAELHATSQRATSEGKLDRAANIEKVAAALEGGSHENAQVKLVRINLGNDLYLPRNENQNDQHLGDLGAMTVLSKDEASGQPIYTIYITEAQYQQQWVNGSGPESAAFVEQAMHEGLESLVGVDHWEITSNYEPLVSNISGALTNRQRRDLDHAEAIGDISYFTRLVRPYKAPKMKSGQISRLT